MYQWYVWKGSMGPTPICAEVLFGNSERDPWSKCRFRLPDVDLSDFGPFFWWLHRFGPIEVCFFLRATLGEEKYPSMLLLITVQACRVSWVEKTRRKKTTGNEPTITCVLLPLATNTSFCFHHITLEGQCAFTWSWNNLQGLCYTSNALVKPYCKITLWCVSGF